MSSTTETKNQSYDDHIPTNRASTRFSTFSVTPTLAPSIAPSHLSTNSSLTPSEKGSPMAQDIHSMHATLARLNEPRLQNQRYVVSDVKKDEIGKLALGAKLDRALDRRMSGQDAVFTAGTKKKQSAASTGLVNATAA